MDNLKKKIVPIGAYFDRRLEAQTTKSRRKREREREFVLSNKKQRKKKKKKPEILRDGLTTDVYDCM